MTGSANCFHPLGLPSCAHHCTCSTLCFLSRCLKWKQNFKQERQHQFACFVLAVLLLSAFFVSDETLKQSQCISDKSHPETSTSASPFAGNGAENGCCLFGLLSLHSSCWLDGPSFPDSSILPANSPIFKPQVMLMLF